MNVTIEGNRQSTQMPVTLSTKLNRLTEQARQDPGLRFQNITHLISKEMMRWAYGELHKGAASGVDGVTSQDYEQNIQGNLDSLHQKLKQGSYRAQPLRRIYIEKEDGKARPLSIPVLEDKIVQKAVSELLTRIYESEFLACSYGYRPNKSAHDALEDIQKGIIFGKVNYVLDADISDYFGSIVRSQLLTMLQKKIIDVHFLRLIGKWLHVGVVEEGNLLLSDTGTYQGSVISPILANIYLHEVLDLWLEKEVKPRMKGEVKLYRYADDFIATFETKEDADRFMQVLPKRMAKYGLKLHPEKTRMIEFGRTSWIKSKSTGTMQNTFSFLGFTLYSGISRKGKWTVKVKTMAKRLSRGLKRIAETCREIRHVPFSHQQLALRTRLMGHYAYYGCRGNYRALFQFYKQVLKTWKKWLSRRSNDGNVQWAKFNQILKKYPLPKPRITHGSLRPRSQTSWFEEFA